MVDKKIIQNALSSTWEIDDNPIWSPENHLNGQSSLTSQIIYDIFGGEILKKPRDKGWHFFNRIGGRIVDFTTREIDNISDNNLNEILISSPNETDKYYEKEDYFRFFLEFVSAFEYLAGLGKQDAEPVNREQIPQNPYTLVLKTRVNL